MSDRIEFLTSPVSVLNLPTMAHNGLERYGISCVLHLISKHPAQLTTNINNYGAKNIRQIQVALAKHDLELNMAKDLLADLEEYRLSPGQALSPEQKAQLEVLAADFISSGADKIEPTKMRVEFLVDGMMADLKGDILKAFSKSAISSGEVREKLFTALQDRIVQVKNEMRPR